MKYFLHTDDIVYLMYFVLSAKFCSCCVVLPSCHTFSSEGLLLMHGFVYLQVSAPFASGFLAFSEKIWRTPSMQVPLYHTSHCLSKFLAGDFVFTETSLSSPSSIAPENRTSFGDYRAWSHATGH